MKIIINRIQNNVFLTVVTTLFMGVAVLFLSDYFGHITTPIVEKYVDLNFYTKNTVYKFYILLLSILFIFALNNGSLKSYGFNVAKNTNYLKMSALTIGVTLGSMFIGGILFMGILNHFFPATNTTGFPKNESILQMILTIWLWSSICEEVLVRGLLQGFIKHFKHIKIARLSLPVLISGFFFGSMHLSLLNAGMGHWFVCVIVLNTTAIGLLAAYYREKSDSLIPPILIHILANVVGSMPIIFQMAFA